MTHSNILSWIIPKTEEPAGLQSMELQRVGHDWATNTVTFMSVQITFVEPVTSWMCTDLIRTCWRTSKPTSPPSARMVKF